MISPGQLAKSKLVSVTQLSKASILNYEVVQYSATSLSTSKNHMVVLRVPKKSYRSIQELYNTPGFSYESSDEFSTYWGPSYVAYVSGKWLGGSVPAPRIKPILSDLSHTVIACINHYIKNQ